MDLSGHKPLRAGARKRTGDDARHKLGEALLTAAWASLASARYEAVDIHLARGQIVRGVCNIRIADTLAEVGCRRDEWTHMFPICDVVLIERAARGQSVR